MGEKAERAKRARGNSLFVVCAAVLPLALYLKTTSGYGYWLDSGEFVAASIGMGIAHPPGHPLAVLVGNLFTWIPLGPHDFRVGLGSAVMASVASYYLYRIASKILRVTTPDHPWVTRPLALAATWLASFSFGWWFQAIRPEVYALQAALLLFALDRITLIEMRWPEPDLRHLYAASLAIGLALANHHLLAFLILLTLTPLLWRLRRRFGFRPLLRAWMTAALGGLTYLYLPLRALSNPMVNLGDPVSIDRFFWVVSAQVFQGNTGTGVPQSFGLRFAHVLEGLGANLHWPLLALALGGVYVGLRLKKTRRLTTYWGSLILVFILARSWLGFVDGNPDALGYLMPALAALSIFAALFITVVLQQIFLKEGSRLRWFPRLVALACAVGSLAQIPAHLPDADLSQFRSTDVFDTAIRRDLPPGAILIAHSPQLVFRYWGGESSESLRPDVTLVPVPFLGYPGMVDALLEREPTLGPFLRGYLLTGELRQPDLQTLSASRPVLVEMDPLVSPELYETLTPAGFFHQVLAGGATSGDCREGAETQRAAMQQIYQGLDDQHRDPETTNRLLWRHYMNTLYYLGFGARSEARMELPFALSLSPESPELIAMQQLLADLEGRGRVDVQPFLPGGG